MQVSKVFIVHKHKSICNINDMFSCHFLGLVELVDFEHPTCRGKSIIILELLPLQGVSFPSILPQGVALGYELLGFQPVLRRLSSLAQF